MSDLLQQVLALPNGARFYRADLHNHTPMDNAFHCGHCAVETEEQKLEFARAYVHFLKETQGIEIVGITEHNDVSWLTYIQQAAEEIGLVVFPGVELGAKDGKRQVHFLALFEPGMSTTQIDHFISSLGLVPGNRFHADGTPKLIDMDTRKLTEHIAQKNTCMRGISIAAHASSKNGLFHELEGEARVLAYTAPHLLAVEITDARDALPEFERSLVNGNLDTYGRKKVACLNHSDGRGLDTVHPERASIGSRFTNIKLSTLSVEALRQAFIDFDSRIRLEGEHRPERYPSLLGMVVEGGFLVTKRDEIIAPFTAHFNPNLNTVIGGRGTGKSSLLEALRYCLDLQARTDATRAQAHEVVEATLPPGSRVTVFYELADGSQYQIIRRKGQEPEVFDIATGERKAVKPEQLLPGGVPVEIYGQKEIFEISKNVAFQLNLLDTYVAEELQEVRLREQDLVRWLESNAADILRFQDEVNQAGQRLLELEGVKLELERMEKHHAATQLARKKSAEREKMLLERAAQAVENKLAALTDFETTHELTRTQLPEDITAEEFAHTDILTAQAILLQRIDELSAATFAGLRDQIAAIWAEGEAQRQIWAQDYKRIQVDYESLIQQLGADFSAERYFAQQARLQSLEGIRRETEKRKQRLEELLGERKVKLATLRRLRRTREYRLRVRKAEVLTDELQSAIKITVTLEGNRKAYAERLAELFAGWHISKAVFEQLSIAKFPPVKGMSEACHYPDPIHLAQAIRCERTVSSEDRSLLAELYEISPAYRQRLAAVDDEVLYALETYRVPDLPDISLKVGEQYRSLTPPEGRPGLSTGQKCTAVLSLILVERNAPLVIDQPEDDLDNEFIYREIVQTLRREKERRQFIIATHNANIPVSGDAELILAMQADQEHGWIEHSGSIDDPAMRKPVEDILEGGKEAFEFRQKKYQILE
ncbi:MAG: AAA family ATPase [Anaerolineae bacterium]|nr:AAA family ATPase [Anaerolineae bacterium]